MALYEQQNPYLSAMQMKVDQGTAGQGHDTVTRQPPGPVEKIHHMAVTGLGVNDLGGSGSNAGGHAGSFTGGNFVAGAVAGKEGERAKGPWEAFIAGGTSFTKATPKDPKSLAALTQDPLMSGLSGLAGHVFNGSPFFK